MPRPQFTLKTMLWLTAVVGVVCLGHRQGFTVIESLLAIGMAVLFNAIARPPV